MEVSLRKLTPSRVALEIELDSGSVDQAFKETYRELSKTAKIPGFRKGKAPREVVERTFGEDDIRMRVWKKLAPQAFLDAVEQAGITPIDLPNFDYAEPRESQPLTVRANVTVKPEPKLGEYKGLKLQRHVATVEDKDVDEQLERARQSRATYQESERREVRKGDLVLADVSILPEGTEEPVAQNDTSFLVGEKRHEPPLDEALIGATVGTSLTIHTEFGAQHPEKTLAGKKAKATLTVKSIKERTLPDLDDEFAKEISDFETMETLRQHVREAFEEIARETTERDLRNQAIRAVSDASEVDVPEQLVVEQTKHSMDGMIGELRHRGLTLEQFLAATQTTTEQLYAQQAAAAREAIRSELVLDAIARQEKIEITGEELDAEIQRMADDQEMKVEDLRHELEEHDQLGRLRGRLRVSKTLDLLIQQAQVEQVQVPHEAESSIIQSGAKTSPERGVTGG